MGFNSGFKRLTWISQKCRTKQINCSRQDTFISGFRLLAGEKMNKRLGSQWLRQVMMTGVLIPFKGRARGVCRVCPGTPKCLKTTTFSFLI